MAIEEVKEAEVPASLKAALEEAKTRGDVFVLHAPENDVTVICKRPGRVLYRKFREEQESGPSKASRRFENLFLASLVAPTPKDFEATLEKFPALADSFGVALWDKVIGTEVASLKKA